MSTPDFLDQMHNGEDAPATDALEIETDTFNSQAEDEGEEIETPTPPPTVEKPATTSTVEDDPKEAAGLKAAMLAERQKRQALEAKLREVEAKQQTEKKPAKQFFEDPQAYVDERVGQVQASYMNALEADMREQHEDYDEMAEIVVEAAKSNPTLQSQVFNAPNPARALYKLGKQLKEAEKLKDPEAYKASIRDELKAELLAELRKEIVTTEPEKQKPTLPRDLSNGRSGTDAVATTMSTDARRPPHLDKLFPVG